MKRLLLFTITVYCTITSSCQKNEDYYSCDPKIDQWAKTNLTEIRTMTRSEWLNIDISYARAAYLASTPEQKQEIWASKVRDVLAMDWSQKEKIHIKLLLDFIEQNKEIFEKNASNDESLCDYVDLFQYKWVSYAREELDWTDKLIFNFAFTIYQIENKNGDILNNSGKNILRLKTKSESRLDCNCNLTSIWYADCEEANCRVLQTGCGFLTFWECNGRHLP